MTLALEGLRVIDLSIARAGPSAVRQLAEYGADVVRIEAPGDTSTIGQDHAGSDYINLHGNKRLMALDLKHPEGQAILRKLLADADVLVENFRPSVTRRLGMHYTDFAEEFPKLIYASISGFGQEGPIAERGAVDQIVQGFAGVMHVTGTPTSGPFRAGIAVADMAAGAFLTSGILLALLERHRTGRGQWVQVSLVEALLSFLDFQAARWTVDHDDPVAAGNHHPTLTPMGTYQAADGFLNVAAPTDRLWVRLCEALDATDLLTDEAFASVEGRHANRDRLNKELQARLATRTRAEWTEALDAVGVPCGPVNTVAEAFQHPLVVDLGMTVQVEHPVRGQVSVLRGPITLSRAPQATKTPSPMPGQDMTEILTELGYSPAEIGQLHGLGVV